MTKSKKIPTNQGVANIILIIVGLALSAILIGFFTSSFKFNNPIVPSAQTPINTYNPNPTQVVTEPTVSSCGLTVLIPKPNAATGDGYLVKGVANGCGWTAFEGQAGTMQAFRIDGTPLSAPIPLVVVGNWMQPSVNFQHTLDLATIPPSGTAGYLLFNNEDPSGENSKTFKLFVSF